MGGAGGGAGLAATGSGSPIAMIIIGRMIPMLSSVTIGARSTTCAGAATVAGAGGCGVAGTGDGALAEEGGASTAGIGVDGAAEGGGVTGAIAGGAGVVAGTASSGIFNVRLERRRDAPAPLLESRVAAVASGVSMSGIAGGPSPLSSASLGAGGAA